MFRFIRNCIIFTILAATVLGVLEVVARKQFDYWQPRHDRLLQEADSISTLVLGNSVFFYGYDPAAARGGRNFSMSLSDQRIATSCAMLEGYLPKLENLKYLLFAAPAEVLAETPTEQLPSRPQLVSYQLHTAHNRFPAYSPLNFEIYNVRSFRQKIVPWYEYEYEPYDEHGRFILSEDIPPEKWEIIAGRSFTHNHYAMPSHLADNLPWLYRMVSLCNARGIKLIAVAPPQDIAYRKLFAPDDSMLTVHNRIFRDLDSKGKLIYLDFFGDERFTRAMFTDPRHLNYAGRELFTNLIWDSIDVRLNNIAADNSNISFP